MIWVEEVGHKKNTILYFMLRLNNRNVIKEIVNLTRPRSRNRQTNVDGNSKLQITNNKQITMTEIVRALLGLPTLRAGPQFQNSKPPYHLKKKRSPNMFGSLIIGI
jgi:hypothetical protein